jgi:hypothetical protein
MIFAFWSLGWGELAMLMTIGVFLHTLFLVVFAVFNRQSHSGDDQQRNKP